MSIIEFTLTYNHFTNQSGGHGDSSEIVPMVGKVRVIPQTTNNKPALAPGHTPPAGFTLRTFEGWIDSDGELKDKKGGTAGLKVWANDPVLGLDELWYKVEFNLTAQGVSAPVEGGFFEAPSTAATVDLVDVLETTGSTITGTTRTIAYLEDLAGVTPIGEALVGAANAAAARDAIGVPRVNVKDYGALGNNSADDTVAVQAAIDAAQALRTTWSANAYQGITVYLPRGRYRLGAITVGNGIRLDGEATILQPKAGFTGTMITFSGHFAGISENLYLLGNSANGEQAITVNANCDHNHISCQATHWGGKVIVDNGVGTRIDSHFLDGMRNDTYVNSFAAGDYIGVVELNGSDAGYIIGTEINATRQGGFGPSTNGVVAALLVGGSNALVYGAVCENGDVGVVNHVGPQGGEWNHYIGVRAEFCFGHGFLLEGGSGVLDSCRAMGNSRSADNTGDAYHFDSGLWTFTGCHSTSEFPADTIEHRYGLYKGASATLVRSAFRSTEDNNAYHDAATATTYATVPEVATLAGSETLTNKTISAASNTVTLRAQEVGQFWTPPGFSYLTGNYYFFSAGATASTSTPTNNRLLLAWVVLPVAVTIQGVFGEITAAGAAGSVMRIGIYNDDGTFKPGSLVLDCGTIAGDSATVQEITGLNTVLPAGGYWVGGVCQSSGTVPTIRAVATTSQPVPSLFSMGTSLPAAGGGANALGVTGITGVLPSTVASFTSSSAPRIGFKVA